MHKRLQQLSQGQTLHASCVLWRRFGLLITGPSGAGKSQLALALLARGSPAILSRLVADDRVAIKAINGRLVAAGPQALQGKIERFGVGIESRPFELAVCLDLAVALKPEAKLERMPEPEARSWRCQGLFLPELTLPLRPLYAVEAIEQMLGALSS